jgi:hypothetical protein
MCSVFAARTVGGVKSELSYKAEATEFTLCGKFHFNNIDPFIIDLSYSSLLFLLSMNRMQSVGRGVKKIGGRRVIHSQSREILISVYSFMKI